jgi:hypothetical protein
MLQEVYGQAVSPLIAFTVSLAGTIAGFAALAFQSGLIAATTITAASRLLNVRLTHS